MFPPTRSAFDHQLADLDTELLLLAAVVAESMGAVTEALATDDHGLAAKVVEGHSGLDPAIRACEDHAYRLMARQQPAGRDLRLLVTVVRLTQELERSGKLVKHVAAFGARPHGSLPPRTAGLVARMAEEAARLFNEAMEAYQQRDVDRAEVLDVWDDRMDELHRLLIAELFTGCLPLKMTLELALVGRYLERIADHAVAIGARVRYLVRGEL